MKMVKFSSLTRLKLTLFLIIQLTVTASASDNSSISSSASWNKLQISPNEICSMPHGSFRVNIYGHSDNEKVATVNSRKKYFYAPIALLDHQSAVCVYNNVTSEPEMRFRIEMWNEQVENEVVNYLGDVVGEKVKAHQVQVIPLEKVILASTKNSNFYSLSTDWLPYQLHKSLWFSLTCFVLADCNKLAKNMRHSPQQFENLKLLFSLTSQQSQTKQTTIRIENIVSGQMVSTLLQRYENDKEVYVSAKDEKRLLTETATNIIVETFDDSDVVSANSESQIHNLLKGLLFTSRTTLSKPNDKMWESVFWNDENYRPDKTSKTLNEIYQKQDKDTKKKLSRAFSKAISTEDNLIFPFDSINIKTEGSKSGHKEHYDKLFTESKEYLEWDGEKFLPKPMSLSRLNLGQLRDRQNLKDRNMQVRYSTAVLTTPINFIQHSNLTLTDEWANLKKTVIGLTNELQGTKKKLMKELNETKATVANLTKELNETKAHVTNLRAELQAKKEIKFSGMPRSCSDLKNIGHTLNGLYSVLGTKQVETLHCDFTKLPREMGAQTLIGYTDVKMTPTYFYVQKTRRFNELNTPITFNVELLNVGSAMDTFTGIFTAPRTGRYFFSLSGMGTFPTESLDMNVALVLNGDQIGVQKPSTSPTNEVTNAIQSTVQLKAGDRVWAIINRNPDTGKRFWEGLRHFIHFNGWILEEDISDSFKI